MLSDRADVIVGHVEYMDGRVIGFLPEEIWG